MSNPSTALATPDFLKGKQAAVFGAAPKESLADGIGTGYAVLRYAGKRLAFSYRGTTYDFLRPDDRSPYTYLDVVILRKAPEKSKSWYPGGFDPNSPDSSKPPACASMNGKRPDPASVQPQSQACAICPRNEWKLQANGRKGRECSDYMRLSVFVLPNFTKAAMGTALAEPMFLRIPPDSLQALASYGDMLNSQGWDYYALVTRLTFDPQKNHPSFVFTPVQPLTEGEGKVMLKLRDDAVSKRITGEDQPQTAVQLAAHEQPSGQRAGLVQQLTQQAQQEVIPPQVVAPRTAPEPLGIEAMGVTATVTPAQNAPALGAAVGQTAEDIGDGGPQSADIDKMLADMLKV